MVSPIPREDDLDAPSRAAETGYTLAVILTTLVAAVALGIAAQVIADRFQIAAILPLLVLGVLAGPSGLAMFDPAALGDVLEVFIHLGVAVILFEGGLTLDPTHLSRVGGPVRNLVTIGVVVTGVGTSLAAHLLLDAPWPLAALYGSIMTVTGPTVIVPMLRHMIAPRGVKTVLLSEGLLVDPIGAVLAYMVLQIFERAGIPWHDLGGELLELTLVGLVLGFSGGALAKLIVGRRVVTGELRNLVILALLMVAYLVAETQAPQSGILAAMVMGFTVSASELPDLSSIRAFKGQLTTLIISMLFILLAGRLDLHSVAQLGWPGVGVVALMILVVRPIAVAASVWPGHLRRRDRVLLALTAPRGIVAAAVASLAAHQMSALGIPGGSVLEGLVYLSILVSCAWSTVMALVLPHLLGYTSDPRRRMAVLVGANPVTEAIALELTAGGRTTVVIDSVGWRLDRLRSQGVGTVIGDARDTMTYEEAGVERDSLVLAATTNDELNLLVAELVHSEFGVEHPVVALQRPPDGLGRRSRGWLDTLAGGGIRIGEWLQRLDRDQASRMVIEVRDESAAALRDMQRETPDDVLPLLAWTGSEPSLAVDVDQLGNADRIVVLVADDRARERLSPFRGKPSDDEAEERLTGAPGE